jgi:hypothetical protein
MHLPAARSTFLLCLGLAGVLQGASSAGHAPDPDRIELSPRLVCFRKKDLAGIEATGAPATKAVEVKASLDPLYRFAIRGLKWDGVEPPLGARIDTVEEGREYRLVISALKVPEDPNAKSVKANLKLLTDDPELPEIALRIVAFF